MSQDSWAFGTLNAKRMTPAEVAKSFVTTDIFREISGFDHCYVVGPRGSGKTTLLRMLQGASLISWTAREAVAYRKRVGYSAIFLPADELWASQAKPESARAAFAVQMLLSFLDTVEYRTSQSSEQIHLPAHLTSAAESNFVLECSEGWGVSPTSHTVLGMQAALDLILLRLGEGADDVGRIGSTGTLELLRFGIRAFNRAVGQPSHRWALLLDELELAPSTIHEEVLRFVRGGTGELILKVSMSPFDRYMHSFPTRAGAPSSGNDFRAVYLSGQSRQDIRRFTEGMWRETLRSAEYRQVSMAKTFGTGSVESATSDPREIAQVLKRARDTDPSFNRWLRAKRIDTDRLDELTYNRRSATIRKAHSLLIFRDALLTFRDGRPVRRSRKKHYEPFTGAQAIATALEGNPRWIKSAFAEMVRSYDPASERVLPGMQLDALRGVAARFDALLHVLPRTVGEGRPVSVPALVDAIAIYFNRENLGDFSADPQNCFTVDADVERTVLDALVLALYAGAVVHVRDRSSSAVLTEFFGQRFRLAYILGVRDGKEFPLRLGKDARLSKIVSNRDLHSGGVLPRASRPLQEELNFDVDR